MKHVSEDKLTEFNIMIEVGDKEKLDEFIRSILPDIKDILDKKFKDLM